MTERSDGVLFFASLVLPNTDLPNRVCYAFGDIHWIKVIVETCLLNEQQKIDICKIVTDAGADFVPHSSRPS